MSQLPRGYIHYISSCYEYQDDVTGRTFERKLDRLKREFKGAAKEAPTCAVPMHAPQTSSCSRGVEEVSSACEVGC